MTTLTPPRAPAAAEQAAALGGPTKRGSQAPLRRSIAAWGGGALAAAGLVVAHRAVAATPWQQANPLEPLDRLFAVALLGVLLCLAWALGRRVLRLGGFAWSSSVEEAAFSTALGLAILAYASFALALAGLLYPAVYLALGAALALLLRADLRLALGAPCHLAGALRRWRPSPAALLLTVWVAAVLGIEVAVALLPPSSYDALMYHLEAPKLFVQAHRFLVLPELPQANFPFTVEMLYTITLLFGSDATAALLHLATGVLTAVALWSFAKRRFGRPVAWLAVIAFATASDVAFWAPTTDIDLSLTCFLFLAFSATVRWLEERQPAWLLLAAALGGVAVGTKDMAVTAVAVLALLIWCANGVRPRALWRQLRWAACFLIIVGAVAAPWFLKNAVAQHNPVYPLLAAPRLDPALSAAITAASPPASAPPASAPTLTGLLSLPLHLLQADNAVALTGRGLRDYLALPLQVYLRGDVEQYGRPSLLMALAPFALLFARRRPTLRWLLLAAALNALLWALGPQELRYLLPTFPLFALLAAVALDRLAALLRRPGLARLAIALPVTLVLTMALVEDSGLFLADRPLPFLAGQESRAAYLARQQTHYGAFVYLRAAMRPGDRALALGEKRGYYADVPIVLDSWTNIAVPIFVTPHDPERSAAILRAANIDYILVSENDLAWLGQFYPGPIADERAAFAHFAQGYLTEVYHTPDVEVYRLNASARGGAPPAPPRARTPAGPPRLPPRE